MRFNTLSEWLAWQESFHAKSIDLGLDRIRSVADRMGLTRPAPVVITVAGTNGKGSCVAFLESMLRCAGYRVGAYTSPHLIHYNERVTLDGCRATDDELVLAFDRVDRGLGDVTLTYFEFGTLAALDMFERAGLDVAVLEVGLGGRLDAVNIVDADCSLITTIGVEHSDWLGPDRESIAREKAGIMRTGRPVVFGDRDVPDAIRTEADRVGARLFCLGSDFEYRAEDGTWSWQHTAGDTSPPRTFEQAFVGAAPLPRTFEQSSVGAASLPRTFGGLPRPTMSGDYQLANAAACLMALASLRDRLTVDDDAVSEGLSSARLAGRLERIEIDGVEVILDVAHNPQAAASLASALSVLPERRPQAAVFAQLQDKDHRGVVTALRDRFDHWYLAGLTGERGLSGHELASRVSDLMPRDGFKVCRDVGHALDLAVHGTGREGRVVVFGSFQTVADVAGKSVSEEL